MESSALLQSFVDYDQSTHFPLENIPFGCFVTSDGQTHCCTRIGDFVFDLANLFDKFTGPCFSSLNGNNIFAKSNLNDFAALGKEFRIEARETLQQLFSKDNEASKDALMAHAVPIGEAKMAMPVFIRDYTDFYSSKNHAYNIGVMFRGKDNALQPNWTHLPVGYHGRASSIVIDGTPVQRPKGQVTQDGKSGVWSACMRLDFELEMGTIIGKGNDLGTPIKVNNAKDHIFGYTMLNDWSARDIQKWEYVPLGPFLAKNFQSTISPWVITPEALAPFKCALPAQEPTLLPYLQDNDLSAYDLQLNVLIKTPKMGDDWHVLSQSNMKHLYYSVAQTIAHHSVTGCNMSAGDMLGSGTISSTEKTGYGSMVELCWGGAEPIQLPSGEERKFLVDGDEINLTAHATSPAGFTIGFGDCRGAILPAKGDEEYF